MSRNITESVSLAGKYAVGEIADFVGVPSYYDAGDSQWMQSNTWVDGDNLPAATKSQIKSVGYSNVALSDNSDCLGFYVNSRASLNTITPEATTATATVFPCNGGSNSTAKAYVVTAAGGSTVNIAQTLGYDNYASYGGGHVITSDGTNLYSWTAASASAFGLYKSTDNGVTWAAESISSQPTFSAATSHSIGPSGTQTYTTAAGVVFQSASSYIQFAAYCGARHLLLGLNGSNQYIAATGSTATSFTDVSAALLGSATVTASRYMFFHRNGNSCFLSVNSVARSTTDGGATWAASTNSLTAGYDTSFKVNTTDPARLGAFTSSTTTMRFSTDSGATWTSRTAPFTVDYSTGCFYGIGATWVLGDRNVGSFYKTTDDGANWSLIASPAGFKGAMQSIVTDGTYWYMISAVSNQIAISSDLVTWTVRNISNPSVSSSYAYTPQNMLASGDNRVGFAGNGPLLISNDGGVTWYWVSASSNTSLTGEGSPIPVAKVVHDKIVHGPMNSNGASYPLILDISDVTTGGAYFKSTTATVAPLRTNAVAFSRVS